MPIIHIVLFEFPSSLAKSQIDDACKAMLALPSKCVHPTTGQLYIKSHSGGRNNSPEGLHGPTTHAFVCEFSNEEDRKYYLEKDPEHLAFVKSIDGVVGDVRVVDFEPGVL